MGGRGFLCLTETLRETVLFSNAYTGESLWKRGKARNNQKKCIISKARKQFLMPKFRLQNYVIVLDWVKSSFFESFSIIQSLNKFKLKIKKKNCQKF